jgi:uncharacterized PurR-regulated membrane protein YhhQ (DUF165 family)
LVFGSVSLSRLIPVFIAVAYVGTVVLANVVTSNFGLIAAGFGLLVPAGTYTAALALSLRDALHEQAGVRWVWFGMAVGTVVSVLTSDGRIALASGAAFAVSELLDLVVYSRLRVRGWRRALVASNIVGSIVDTVLFLWLSGFGLSFQGVGGQVLVKAVWVTGAALLLAEAIRRVLRNRVLTASKLA